MHMHITLSDCKYNKSVNAKKSVAHGNLTARAHTLITAGGRGGGGGAHTHARAQTRSHNPLVVSGCQKSAVAAEI